MSAHKITNVQDTTGAGDTFVGAYAVYVAHTIHSKGTFSLSAAVRFAMCAAALSVSKRGTIDSIPWTEEVAYFARSEGLPDDCWNWNPCLDEMYIPVESDDDDGHGDGDSDSKSNKNSSGSGAAKSVTSSNA